MSFAFFCLGEIYYFVLIAGLAEMGLNFAETGLDLASTFDFGGLFSFFCWRIFTLEAFFDKPIHPFFFVIVILVQL